MKIIEVKNRTPDLTNRLLSVWESSVRATHLFLSDGEIQSIKEYVPQRMDRWKCCSLHRKNEGKGWENA